MQKFHINEADARMYIENSMAGTHTNTRTGDDLYTDRKSHVCFKAECRLNVHIEHFAMIIYFWGGLVFF